jgi:hypothetical protein
MYSRKILLVCNDLRIFKDTVGPEDVQADWLSNNIDWRMRSQLAFSWRKGSYN